MTAGTNLDNALIICGVDETGHPEAIYDDGYKLEGIRRMQNNSGTNPCR